jgi:hypothetical protein
VPGVEPKALLERTFVPTCQVYPGQQVDITVDAYPDSTLTGCVREINPGSRMPKPPEIFRNSPRWSR